MWIETKSWCATAWWLDKFIRQQWRMWIETGLRVNNQGQMITNSFASNGECGLKHQFLVFGERLCLIHSPAMANVD